MAYLDLTPMLQAMRARPSEFEMQGTYLRHIPSHHLLNFDIWGNARVHARCDCAMLDVSREQSEEMKAAIAAWKVVYWEPHLAQIEAEKRAAKINREFASHFRPSLWQKFLALFRREDQALPLLPLDDEPAGTPAATGPAERVRATRQSELLTN
ncbi:MAG TPA: hypothetical protein VFA50_14560 [Stellaceae bacterium]|nr:hypothetical protein [Stellaceae bacterium]